MPSEMTDTIILHPNNDGTYHWMCPNCKCENLGLSDSEINLADYLPNVTCPNCGFQFGVDKRYLNELPALNQMAANVMKNEEIEDRCPDCGSTEAGNCFYCKAD